ncbi:hypothetical protein OF83DRAFT_680569 [Amylostereum chailletii]|nr:hypothetical protein OF83DRAFT_680569 [Amylostereum chailletii]
MLTMGHLVHTARRETRSDGCELEWADDDGREPHVRIRSGIGLVQAWRGVCPPCAGCTRRVFNGECDDEEEKATRSRGGGGLG